MKSSWLAVVLILFFISEEVYSIPAFSRKYKTSCITCHATYPRLNPFGEAFRYNGYRFPADDSEQVKEVPVQLGSEAYKRVWPDAVWPSDMPATAPLALRARSAFIVENQNDTLTYSEFAAPVLQLLAAATFSDFITVFVGAHLFEEGDVGSLDRAFVRFNDLFKKIIPPGALNIRVGQFIPDIVPFASNHRGITNTAYSFNTYSPEYGDEFVSGHIHGAGPFSLENFQLGVETSGTVKKRFRYVAGIVNGNGVSPDNNSKRDYFGRLSYKIGGMAFDGSYREGANTDREASLTLGVFGYKGFNTINSGTVDFNRIGVDVNIWLDKWNFVGGYINGSDSDLEADKYNLFFMDVYYAFFPWMTGLVRYEQANPKGIQGNIKRVVPHISTQIISNVLVKVESRLDPDDPKFNNLYFGFDFAF